MKREKLAFGLEGPLVPEMRDLTDVADEILPAKFC